MPGDIETNLVTWIKNKTIVCPCQFHAAKSRKNVVVHQLSATILSHEIYSLGKTDIYVYNYCLKGNKMGWGVVEKYTCFGKDQA